MKKPSIRRFGFGLLLSYSPIWVVSGVFHLPIWAYVLLAAGMVANSMVTGCYHASVFDDSKEDRYR